MWPTTSRTRQPAHNVVRSQSSTSSVCRNAEKSAFSASCKARKSVIPDRLRAVRPRSVVRRGQDSCVTERPFRFGISVWGAASRDDWRTKARRAESAGFDTLLIADHLIDGMFSSLSALVAAAEATERIRVGTLVMNNDFRHPVVLARDAAVVDLLTDGRLELGLGAGHMKHEYDRAGLQFDPPKVRVA